MLKGTLDDFTLPDIFRLMSLSKKTGSLAVERSAGQGRVWFRDGEVYYAESSLSKEPLGQKLVKAKALTEGQLRKALDQHAGSGKRLGEVLLESGMVDEDQIMMVIRQQIEDAAFDLLRWELGEFLWEPSVEATPEVTIYVTVENLIMEASRRLDELEVIQRKIPSPETVLAMAATPPEGAVEINITPEEWRILVLVNGTRTVREIGEMVGLDEFGAMRTLYGLVSAGLIEVPGHADVVETSFSSAVAEDEQVEEVPEPEAAAEPEPESFEAPAAEAEPVAEADPVAEIVAPEPITEVAAEPEPDFVQQAPEPTPVVEEATAEAVVEFETPAAQPEEAPVAEQPAEEAPVAELDPDAEAEAFYSVDDVQTPPEAQVDEPVLAEAALPEPEALLSDPEPPAFDHAPERPLQSVPDIPAAADEPEIPVEAFDAPGPGELVAEGPSSNGFEDPLATEILAEPAPAAPVEEPQAPPAPEPVAEQPEAPAAQIPVSSEPAGESPRVDRIAAVRELAGLFSEGEEEEGSRSRTRAAAPEGEGAPDTRKRVEDDEQVTRGLISRLIDGVKGL